MSSTTAAPQPLADAAAHPTASSDTTVATASSATQDGPGRQPTTAAAAAAELASTKIKLLGSLKSFPDFPIKGIQFIDILPLFQDPATHLALLRALELQVLESGVKPDVVVGLDARGFLFGPSLALRLNASFVPVRKRGKMPGPCVSVAYEKEYGVDYFEMQEGAVKPGQKVLVVDDIIATGELTPETPPSLSSEKTGKKVSSRLFFLPVRLYPRPAGITSAAQRHGMARSAPCDLPCDRPGDPANQPSCPSPHLFFLNQTQHHHLIVRRQKTDSASFRRIRCRCGRPC